MWSLNLGNKYMIIKFDSYKIQEEQIKEFCNNNKKIKEFPNLFEKSDLNEVIECILHNQDTAWKKYMVYYKNTWRWKINEGVKNPKPRVALSSSDLSVLMFRERSRDTVAPLEGAYAVLWFECKCQLGTELALFSWCSPVCSDGWVTYCKAYAGHGLAKYGQITIFYSKQ